MPGHQAGENQDGSTAIEMSPLEADEVTFGPFLKAARMQTKNHVKLAYMLLFVTLFCST